MYDLIIVGGGPAGATLARLIGKKYKILLLEKRRFGIAKNGRKSCGGLLAPDAQKMLARLGLGIPNSVLVGPQLFAVRTIDIPNSIERFYQRHYININREAFDQWLESLVPADTTILNGSVYQTHEAKGNNFEISFYYNGELHKELTRAVVGADGAFSKVRRQAFPQYPSPRKYISIQEWYEADNTQPYYGAIFDEEITDFYSWTIPKENFFILGTALELGGNVLNKFDRLKEKLTRYGFPLSKSVKREGSYLLRPLKVNEVCIGKGNIALIGEAAGFISPSSAEGFSYAFKSALAIAQALEEGMEDFMVRYRKNVSSLRTNVIYKNIKSLGMYHPMIRKMVMKSGLQSLDIYK